MKYYHKIKKLSNGTIIEYSYNREDLPLNKPIYGFAYSVNDDTRDKRLNCLPVLGEITDGAYFTPYKKGTNEKRISGKVQLNSRWYADTYEEAVEMYNELVQKRIDNLKLMIEEAENDKIK